jgi:hypothetical protein
MLGGDPERADKMLAMLSQQFPQNHFLALLRAEWCLQPMWDQAGFDAWYEGMAPKLEIWKTSWLEGNGLDSSLNLFNATALKRLNALKQSKDLF